MRLFMFLLILLVVAIFEGMLNYALSVECDEGHDCLPCGLVRDVDGELMKFDHWRIDLDDKPCAWCYTINHKERSNEKIASNNTVRF